MTRGLALAVVVLAASSLACSNKQDAGPPRAGGYVEATDVRVAAKVGGRVTNVLVSEGATVEVGQQLVTIATTDLDLAVDRATADRDQAQAQVKLLESGARPEDIAQARAQAAAAVADRQSAEGELASARADEARFEQLLQNKAGSVKQRDDATTRRKLAESRVQASADRARAAAAGVDRLLAGAHPQELAAARARVRSVEAQIAMLKHDRQETDIRSPMKGIVSSRLVEPGELVAPGTPLIVLIDLDHAWANAYVEETLVPGLRLDAAVTVVTDAGDRLPGRIAFISPRAEFTPRNVQTATERAKLVYRVKVAVDNSKGVLKPGMPVEVELGAPAAR